MSNRSVAYPWHLVCVQEISKSEYVGFNFFWDSYSPGLDSSFIMYPVLFLNQGFFKINILAPKSINLYPRVDFFFSFIYEEVIKFRIYYEIERIRTGFGLGLLQCKKNSSLSLWLQYQNEREEYEWYAYKAMVFVVIFNHGSNKDIMIENLYVSVRKRTLSFSKSHFKNVSHC